VSDTAPSESRARKLPSIFYNLTTMIGITLAALSFGLILFVLALEFFSEETSPYMGIVAFIILPVFLLIGVALALGGALRESRRRRAGLPPTQQLPRIDLNDPRQRRAAAIIAVGGIILLTLSGWGSYKAYEYTESTQFCGVMCHQVMHPEYTAFTVSPHARVDCVECHIGPGATWFVRSKLSGAYQVYATIFNRFPRPIPTPIKNLRPARDTCEECHWPEHFTSDNYVVHDYFMPDENNSHWRLHLLMKVGGAGDRIRGPHGIHWHTAAQVEYVASDERRLEIPWVRVTRPDGSTETYVSTDSDFGEASLATAEIRLMDCIDCHNRPTHHYDPPARLVNRSIAAGRIARDLPSVKEIAVEAMSEVYDSSNDALENIPAVIRGYYEDDHPELVEERANDIDDAVEHVQWLFAHNLFPDMKVSWRDFPDHIGHLTTPGCFRCHDGLHENDAGNVISRDCNVCHVILSQEFDDGSGFVALGGDEYRHPEDIDGAWQEMNCSDCHGE
jgi:nitrate/TMAO reductase-like tetraheme cytochrome c subunit